MTSVTPKLFSSYLVIMLMANVDVLFVNSRYVTPSYSILSAGSSPQGYDDNIICNKAKCTYKQHVSYNVSNSKCGNHYVCKKCPISTGNNICYLGITSPLSVNIGEGELLVSHKDSKRIEDKVDEKEEEEEEDEKSFIQKNIEVISFVFKENMTKSELSEKKRMCVVGSDGSIDLSIRLIMQWYKDPLYTSAQDLTSQSMLEMAEGNNYDEEEGESDRPSKMERRITFLKNAFNKSIKIRNKIEPIISKPKLQIQFVVDHIEMNQCRAPQLWKGALQKKSLIFVGNQNFRIKNKELDIDFLKSAIKVDVTTKSIVNLKFNSCIQIHCTKRMTTQNTIYNANTMLRPAHPNISQNVMRMNYNTPIQPNVYGQSFNVVPASPYYSGMNILGICIMYYVFQLYYTLNN